MKLIRRNVYRSYATSHQRLLSVNSLLSTVVCRLSPVAVSVVMLFASGSVVAQTFRQVSELLKFRSSNELPCYSLEEVGRHDDYHDCWIILFDKIYNVTDFIHRHPGGETIILEHAGRDATFTFLSAGHAEQMMAVLNNYLIGRLPCCEQIFEIESIPE